ncbi:nicotinate-nucleotide adenylyltransferase [Aciduricibacillus chroicocephali]|uniref:Probable nicotinate-nucleotide adenylyltransferase n=1 Tax=Aciduricibacillus chroicocephali TaxID=3054939 RepID=A0ABY9KS64_9BACI|nr:nicotinate-nucleotide adenylyltransferase [Bacillaceae bacterium 44XB]
MKKVGILGGTFDPPHNGHLLAAEQVRTALQLDEIWFLPAGMPPHKKSTATPAPMRLRMTELAIQSNCHFKVNGIELERSGPSYTIDTMKELKRNHPDSQFYFIIGADMIAYLPKWHKIDELSRLIEFAGVNRSGYSVETVYPVHLVNIPAFDISSTLVRKRIKEGMSVKYMVPDQVIQFIKEHQLYES